MIPRPLRSGPAWVAALAIAAYLPVLGAGFVWDDDAHVTRNPVLHDADGLRRIWLEPRSLPQYYPLVHTTFWVEYHLWGLHPAGYHLVNVLLHAANAALVAVVLARLRVPGAWLAAAVFAVHPLHVESVAWITERKNVLSGLFYLAALSRWPELEGAEEREPSWSRFVPAVALFAGALLSKTVTATLPVAILIAGLWRRHWPSRRAGWVLAAMLGAGAGCGALTAWLEAHHVGATGAEWDLGIVERLLVAGRIFWFYLGKLAWPHPLAFVYARFEPDPLAPLGYLFPLAAAALFVAAWRLRTRLGPGPLAALSFYGCTLAPALGFVNVFPMRYSFVADHFAYLASIGPIALAAAGLSRALRGRATAVAGIGLAALAALSWIQIGQYRDEETLWRATIARSPRAWMAHYNLANLARRRGATAEARAGYQRSLELKPDLVDAAVNLANLLSDEGRLDEAIALLERTLERTADAVGRQNLGALYYRRGDVDAAIGAYEAALRIEPRLAAAHYGLGVALARLGRLDDAVARYREALRCDPALAPAHHNLGAALWAQGRADEAIAEFRAAVQLDPGLVQAHYNLAVALAARGATDEAIAEFQTALRLDPGLSAAHEALARLMQ